MKAWQLMYKDEVLGEAENITDLKIIKNDGIQIIAEIEGYGVTTFIEYNSPTLVSCRCPQMTPCKHAAALMFYLEVHLDLFSVDLNLKETMYLISTNDLREFLLDEFKSNPDLKDRFLERFKTGSIIDKKHYEDKLSEVFKSGEGRDFELHSIYDLDLMQSGLTDFLNVDIENILIAGEHDFACDLLCRIGDLLDDELMSTYDSWEDLSTIFMNHVFSLSTSIYLDASKMEELNSKTDLIINIITTF